MTGIESGEKPIIKVRGLHKYFGPMHIIKGVDLDVRPSEVVVVIGPSGGGKSTFLRCLNFLKEPSAGTIEIDGLEINAEESAGQRKKRIREISRKAAMIFQLLIFLVFLSYAAVVHAGGNTTASTLFVYKPDGTIQCDKFHGVALDTMEQELKSADIKVFSRQKGYDGREGIALCGAPTGQINVYEIASSDVPEAVRLGFKQLPENRIGKDQ